MFQSKRNLAMEVLRRKVLGSALRKRLDLEMLLLLKLLDHAIVQFVNTCTLSLTARIRPFICIEEIKREDFKP